MGQDVGFRVSCFGFRVQGLGIKSLGIQGLFVPPPIKDC